MNQNKITIVGGGLVGALQSIFLAKRGYSVEVYEKRADPGSKGYVGGRSINLALSDRGWRALDFVGLRASIEKIAIPMKGRMIHHQNGDQVFQAYGKSDQAIYSVSRSALNVALIEEAQKYPSIQFFFDQDCVQADFKSKTLQFKHHPSQTMISVQYERLISTDGAYSAVRQSMMTLPRFEYQQHYISHGYKELSMPAKNNMHVLDKNALHIWPRKDFMMIALPNPDGTFTCTLFLAYEGKNSFEKIQHYSDFEVFFKAEFPDAYPLFPNLKQEFNENPISNLMIVKCYPWHVNKEVVLMGDAAHAIVPFFGQGMNCGFEDCLVMNHLIDEEKGQWDKVFERFSNERKPDGDAICDLALQNFIEMRDLVASPAFLLRKKIEAKVYEKHPSKWVPLYSMVTFSPEISYSKAYQIGLKQNAIMDEIMKLPDIETRCMDMQLFDEIANKI